MYVLSSMIELIDILKVDQFMVIASIHFHNLPRLNRLICHEAYTSLLRFQPTELLAISEWIHFYGIHYSVFQKNVCKNVYMCIRL